jgi:hypothetical protein
MAQFLLIIQILTALMPFIHQVIVSLEALIPQSGQGALKLATTKAYIQTVFAGMGNLGVKFEQIWPLAQVMINATVGAMNAAGVVSNKVASNVDKIQDKITTTGGAIAGAISTLGKASPV